MKVIILCSTLTFHQSALSNITCMQGHQSIRDRGVASPPKFALGDINCIVAPKLSEDTGHVGHVPYFCIRSAISFKICCASRQLGNEFYHSYDHSVTYCVCKYH